MEKHYYILGLDATSSTEEIKKTYRILARICHPDVHAHDPELQQAANILFRRIKEAYEQISGNDGGSRTNSSDPNNSAKKSSEKKSQSSGAESPRDGASGLKVQAARNPGPVRASTPSGSHKAGGYVHFLVGTTKIFPDSGTRMPTWRTVEEFALNLQSDFHASGEKFYYLKLNRFDLVVLKYVLNYKNYGFVVIFRCYEGKFWYTTNDSNRRWQNLPLAYLTSEVWSGGAENIVVDFVRPNAGVDDDRQIDYRFRIQESSSSGRKGSSYNSNLDCPACGASLWNGTSCSVCNFYLY